MVLVIETKDVDRTAIAMQNLILAATEVELGTCWIAASTRLESRYVCAHKSYVHAVGLAFDLRRVHHDSYWPLYFVVNIVSCADTLTAVLVDRASSCSQTRDRYLGSRGGV